MIKNRDAKEISQTGCDKLKAASNLQELEAVRVAYRGKKGEITHLFAALKEIPAQDKATAAKDINQAASQFDACYQECHSQLEQAALNARLQAEKIDVTLPGRGQQLGALHPLTLVCQRVEAIFRSMGFSVAEGPEIEDEEHNFSALNIPEHHPARAMHDTFYFEDGLLLRTHTSPVQIHTMKHTKPPIKVITMGRAYRCDSDQTHSPMFHQMEALMIDDSTTFADLKGVLTDFLQLFFERELKMRFRASYFPFTEPSAEVDIEWGDSWLEVLGCGMVHPNVLEATGIDSERYQGFAFGLGLDRLAMLRYGIDDLRLFFENDQRFLNQFR